MNIKSGIKLLDQKEGSGLIAERGDHITYNIRALLSHGDEIPINSLSETDRQNMLTHHPEAITMADGYEFINFNIQLGQRDVCAGVEYSIYGMREGGFRKVRVSPHLAYGDEGIPDCVPKNAVIIFQIWLRKINHKAQPGAAADRKQGGG